MANALTVAKYIVTQCMNMSNPISNLHLQFLLYFVNQESLRFYKAPLFYNEIAFWTCGPIIPDVYYHFCGFGVMPIWATYDDVQLSEKEKEIIDNVIKAKGNIEPLALLREIQKEVKNG